MTSRIVYRELPPPLRLNGEKMTKGNSRVSTTFVCLDLYGLEQGWSSCRRQRHSRDHSAITSPSHLAFGQKNVPILMKIQIDNLVCNLPAFGLLPKNRGRQTKSRCDLRHSMWLRYPVKRNHMEGAQLS